MVWQGEVAHQMALLPVALLGGLRLRSHRRDAAWWFLAGAFFISWCADTAADLIPRSYDWVPSLVYPVSQSALVAAVLLPRYQAMLVLDVLIVTGVFVAYQHGATAPDIALRSVAWLAVVGIVWSRWELPMRLRTALFVYFGIGWVAWLAHVEWIHYHLDAHGAAPTYYPYQAVRLAGLLLFCYAAYANGPHLRVIPRLP